MKVYTVKTESIKGWEERGDYASLTDANERVYMLKQNMPYVKWVIVGWGGPGKGFFPYIVNGNI